VLQVAENTAANAARGAGVQSVDIMRRLGVSAVLSGAFGPKAAAGLRSLGTAMVEVPGSPAAAEALADYQQGKLSAR
jgi:predicted Fe-Mo cluster-binding NifX family protein